VEKSVTQFLAKSSKLPKRVKIGKTRKDLLKSKWKVTRR